MGYRDDLRWEGGASLLLGAAMAIVAFPGLVVSYDHAWSALLWVPATLAALGAWATLRRGVPFAQVDRWLTERPLAGAAPGRPVLDARRLKRRVAIETGLWIAAVCGWVVFAGSSGWLVFGTGLASMAYGAVQAVAAPRAVARAEQARGVRFYVSERPGVGTPTLSSVSVDP